MGRAWKSGATLREQTDKFSKVLYESTEAADRQIVDHVGEVAKKRGTPQAQVALAWLLTKPSVNSPIVGATKLHHLEDAVASVSVKLTEEEIGLLEEPYIPHPVKGFQ